MPRPKLNPTDEDRRLVKSLAAVGTRQEDIARMTHIRSTKTLRKHFREELDRGAIESNANVARTLYQMATSGEHPATTIFWLKSRAGWKDRPSFETGTAAPPPFIVAKEEAA
jgi:hypothetical protein